MDAFDADAIIYAAVPQHPLGRRVLALFQDGPAGAGSVLLLPEVLGRPLRHGDATEVRVLSQLLARAADATHLATAVALGADRFITNSQRAFPASISGIQVMYPSGLPDPAA